MTATLGTDPPPASGRRERVPGKARRWSPLNLAVALMVMSGAGLIAYPSAGSWITDLTQGATVSGYAQTVAETDSAELASLLDEARDYNRNLPDGPLRDPYILNEEGGADDIEHGKDEYLAQLSIRPDAPMARIRVPRIGVDLPVYHGTDEDTLAHGVGHLYGSALPVGGASTHSVLTGHSGIPGATLFTRLGELELGDIFMIDVAGESLAYRVDEVQTVLPDDGDALREVAGKDYVTLLTCTPTGVNTHRLLVRGERIDSSSAEDGAIPLAAQARPGVPWDAIAVLIVGFAIAIGIAAPRSSSTSSRIRGRGAAGGASVR